MIKLIGTVTYQEPQADPEADPIQHTRDGYFVNSTELLAGLDEYLAEDDSHITKIFGAPTYHYQFTSEEQAIAALGYWYPSEENEPYQVLYRKADKRRKTRILEIKALAEELYVQDVTDESGNTWKGGEPSAIKIKGAVGLAEFAGLTEFTVTDAKREPHVMTLEAAKAVAALIGADYQRKFLARQAACRALEQIDCFAADALAQIESIKLEV